MIENTIQEIREEVARQEILWGIHAYDYPGKPWLAILMEEVGEVSREYLISLEDGREGAVARMRTELIQVAAVVTFWASELK